MKILDDGTVLLRLPVTMQREISGGCQCPFCKTHPDHLPMWDALAGHPRDGRTWTVHAPELAYERDYSEVVMREPKNA